MHTLRKALETKAFNIRVGIEASSVAKGLGNLGLPFSRWT